MTKLEYLKECLKRNPKLRDDILTFHQEFPPVFAGEFKPRDQFPDWLKSILEPSDLKDKFDKFLYVGRPKKFEDVKTLHSMSVQIEGFRMIMIGEGSYYEVIKKKPHEYDRMLKQYLGKWPEITKSTFLHGIFEPDHPPLLVLGFPLGKGASGNLKADLNRLAERVKVWIPVYEDTSKDDIDWGEIAKIQWFIYGVKRRKQNDRYSRKLEIWDTYQELKNFAAVGRKLNVPRTTVEEMYISVYKDIMGTNPPGKLREKQAAGTSENHFQECAKCKSAKRFKDMCPAGRALADINYVSQRERTGEVKRFEDNEFDIVDNLAVEPDEDSIISRIDEEKKEKEIRNSE